MIDRTLNRITLRGLYISFALGSVVWVAVWLAFRGTDWVNTWAPNVAAELSGAFLTVAVLQIVIDRRERPLREFAARRIDHAVLALLQTPMTYRFRMSKDVPETLDPRQMLDDWKDELSRQLPEWDWLLYWAKYLASTEPLLSNVRDRYDRVLPERLLTALDDFALWATRSATDITWAQTIDGAQEGNKSPTAEWAAVSVSDHFTAAVAKLDELFAAYEAAIGTPLMLTEEMWRAARAHRRAHIAGPPLL